MKDRLLKAVELELNSDEKMAALKEVGRCMAELKNAINAFNDTELEIKIVEGKE